MLSLLSLAGCGDPEPRPTAHEDASASLTHPSATTSAPAADEAAATEKPPVLPQAPWFELPADWGEQHPIVSPNAQFEAHWSSLAERQLERNPADGSGRAWVRSVRPIADPGRDDTGDGVRVPAASRQRIDIVFEVAEYGIAEGGLLFVQADPFWSWSTAQTQDPGVSGYTTATPATSGVELVPVPEIPGGFRVVGRALRAGEQIEIRYGAGPLGARVDAYAERAAEILIGVDADGDGRRSWLADAPRIDILAHDAATLIAFGPADIAPGGDLELQLAVVDARGNRALWPGAREDRADRAEQAGPSAAVCASRRFAIESLPESPLAITPDVYSADGGCDPNAPRRIRLRSPDREGTLRLRVRGVDALAGFESELPPIVLRRTTDARLVWADLHGHSQYSDGTGHPEDYFGYARDVARLDVVALTDHDHWGIRPLDATPERAEEILETARRFHRPGRFVTLPGYEWTNWLHGHRHVLYFEDEAPIFSAIDPATDRPDELWAALRGRRALTFAHHSAGEPVATNWFYRPDPELEPLTEITSVHGMSEAADAPLPVRGGVPGYFVRDTLLRGDRLGFIGSGDSHDGHPGLTEIASGQGGLAGLFTRQLDRPSLLEAMRARSTFATNGIRPFLDVSIDATPMGGTLRQGSSDHTLRIRYEATGPVERIDLIRSGHLATLAGDAALGIDLERRIPPLRAGDFHYVRIVQEDGGVAWSSPIFVDPPQDR